MAAWRNLFSSSNLSRCAQQILFETSNVQKISNFYINRATAASCMRQYSSISSKYDLSWTEVQPYNAIRVKLNDNQQNISSEAFQIQLKEHIDQWMNEGRSAVWLHVPVSLSWLVSAADLVSFRLHHAFNGEIVMCRWLDGSRESKIPPFASHQVGVCGVVLREDTQEILVTQDKYKPARWKFPGGISEFAEKISDTAEREVLEETGIVAKFNSIIAFRQHHKIPTAFDQSDLYFICHMTPLSYDITPCQDEILKCQWVGLRELQLSPQATQLTNRIAELILEGLKDGFDNIHIIPEEWPSLIPGYTYELFMKKSVTKND